MLKEEIRLGLVNLSRHSEVLSLEELGRVRESFPNLRSASQQEQRRVFEGDKDIANRVENTRGMVNFRLARSDAPQCSLVYQLSRMGGGFGCPSMGCPDQPGYRVYSG